MKKIFTSKAPLRITLSGCYTDIICKLTGYSGSWISAAINKFVHVSVKKQPGRKTWINDNGKVEKYGNLNGINNELIRATLSYFNLKSDLSIEIRSDLEKGTGLGGSAALLTALLFSLNKCLNYRMDKRKIAELAYTIESEILKKPVGPRDHYISVFGGIRCFSYSENNITVKLIDIEKEFSRKLESSIFLIPTQSRLSYDILNEVSHNIKSVFSKKHIIKIMNINENNHLQVLSAIKKSNIKEIVDLLKTQWIVKKSLSVHISSKHINTIVDLIDSKSSSSLLQGGGSGGWIMTLSSDQNGLQKLLNSNMTKYISVKIDYCGTV